MPRPKSHTPAAQEQVAPPAPVAAYLHAVADPDSLRDLSAIGEIDQRLAQEDLDPAEKLELLLSRRALNSVDIRPLEDAFVKAVPEYLAQLGLEVAEVREDFLAVGVEPEILDRIAFGRRAAKGGTVSVDEVRSYALSRGARFTQKDLMEATGASRGTVSKVVKSLLEEQRLAADNSRPTLYEVR